MFIDKLGTNHNILIILKGNWLGWISGISFKKIYHSNNIIKNNILFMFIFIYHFIEILIIEYIKSSINILWKYFYEHIIY